MRATPQKVDHKKSRMLWRPFGQTIFVSSKTEEKVERKFNNAISELMSKPFEGMIFHSIGSPEVGWSKPLVDISHLVSGALVCTDSSNLTIATTTLFLAQLDHSCCCQSSSLGRNTYTSASRGIRGHAYCTVSGTAAVARNHSTVLSFCQYRQNQTEGQQATITLS